jgi:NADH dehydrogenase [ubiquinone] 1 alpha subcomplex assembly factor 6
MGRKKRPSAAQTGQTNGVEIPDPKRARSNNETGEKYLVKKYRADKMYNSMQAMVKYTKSHRMSDAAYVRWKVGVSTEKPFVFSVRVAQVDLGWGRGKTRDASIDAGKLLLLLLLL